MSLIGTLTSGVSALRSFTKNLEIIGNNIANVNTTSFKASRTTFADSFSNTLRTSTPSGTGVSNTSAMQVGTGVTMSHITPRFTQGVLTPTGYNTDLGISGNGFFRVQAPDGTDYATRAGEFRIDDNGFLVTAQGYFVMGLTGGTTTTPPGGAPDKIQLGTPPGTTKLQSFSFDPSGFLVEFYSDGSSARTNQVLLQTFKDPTALVREGNNLFTGFSAAGASTFDGANGVPGTSGLGSIQAGTLELANVDLTDEFANMISTQRAFQASSRLISVSDQVLEEVVNLKR